MFRNYSKKDSCLLKFLFLITLFLCFGLSGGAQNLPGDLYSSKVHLYGSLSLENDFNSGNWYIGASAGIEDVRNQWGSRFGISFTPAKTRIAYLDSLGFLDTLQVKRIFAYLLVDKRFLHFSLFNAHAQFFIGTKVGLLTSESYSFIETPKDWIVSPSAGLCFNFRDGIFLKIGYSYFKDPQSIDLIATGKISISAIFMLDY